MIFFSEPLRQQHHGSPTMAMCVKHRSFGTLHQKTVPSHLLQELLQVDEIVASLT